jgi:hypothetical protein
MKGKIVGEIPPPGSHAKRTYNWDKSALLAQTTPGQAVLAAKDVPISQIASVREYKRAPFRTNEGRIKVAMRDSYEASDGRRHGDVYFVWEPATTTDKKD